MRWFKKKKALLDKNTQKERCRDQFIDRLDLLDLKKRGILKSLKNEGAEGEKKGIPGESAMTRVSANLDQGILAEYNDLLTNSDFLLEDLSGVEKYQEIPEIAQLGKKLSHIKSEREILLDNQVALLTDLCTKIDNYQDGDGGYEMIH